MLTANLDHFRYRLCFADPLTVLHIHIEHTYLVDKNVMIAYNDPAEANTAPINGGEKAARRRASAHDNGVNTHLVQIKATTPAEQG